MNPSKLIWFAMVGSTLIYFAIIYTLGKPVEGSFQDAFMRHQFTPILYGIAAVTFIMGNVLPGRSRGPARLKMVIALALFESCAIYGLVAAFVVHDWRLFIPTWILCLIGMVRVYPSDEPSAEQQHIPR